ncbi:ELKS/Rab6-interacting/CAST family protein [Vibrio parahaemolyticus]
MALITVTSRIGELKLLQIARPITAEDLVLNTTSPMDDPRYVGGSIYTSLTGKLKQDVALELLSILETPMCEKGKFLSHREPATHLVLSGGENPETHMDVVLLAEVPCSMRGVKRENQQKRLDEATAKLKELAEKNKEAALTKLVESLNSNLEVMVNSINCEFQERVKSIVVDLNVSDQWFEENLSEEEQIGISLQEQASAEIRAQIDELQAKLKESKDAIYKTKRNAVTTKLKDSLCDDGKVMVDSLRNVEKEKSFADSFSFN